MKCSRSSGSSFRGKLVLRVPLLLIGIGIALGPGPGPARGAQPSPPIQITEFMAANVATLADEDGDFPDWIEIFNGGGADQNLNGWFLTDDEGVPGKWSFPSTNLIAGTRLVVFASGKNRRVPGAPLHCNFQLSADGGFLALVQPDGTVVSSFGPGYPRQRADISYGFNGATGTNGFLVPPTPGATNGTGVAEFVADTKFSHARGFYETNFALSITCATPGATIYYTTNGSAPSSTNGLVYSGPLPISRTTTLRARAEKTNAIPSDVDTQTYLFLADVIHQSPGGEVPAGWPANWGATNVVVDYGMDPEIVTNLPWSGTISNDLRSIPTFSLVMRLEDLFDEQTGIYGNAYSEGPEWEKPGSIELIYPDGRTGFQIDLGVRIRGGFSRAPTNPKHSFRFLCRDQYGQARLRFPLFGPGGAPDFDRFDLRTSQDNSWAFQGDDGGTFVTDPFVRATLLATGQPSERGSWYHLYINGEYWGLYNSCERPEANFAASYFGGVAEDYDVLKPDPQNGYVMKNTDGDDAAWIRLWQAATNGFASTASYFKVQGRNPDGTVNPGYENLLDVTNLVDYLLTIIYVGDIDGPIYGDLNAPDAIINNFYAFRSRLNTGGFRFVCHDAELALRDPQENRAGTTALGSPAHGDGPSRSNPHYLATRLRANAEFKMLLADRVQKHFFDGGAMTLEASTARFKAMTNELHRAITGESARWGDAKRSNPITREDWLSAVNLPEILFFPERTSIVLDQLRAEHLFPSVTAPWFSVAGGEVAFGAGVTLQHSNSAGRIYYTLDGSDPRAIGGGISASALVDGMPIPITSSRMIRARVKNSATWSPIVERTYYPAQDFSGLALTEIMYHPAGAALLSVDDVEFLEFKNTGTNALDLGGVSVGGVGFVFTNGTLLPPGGFFVLGRNSAQLTARYPGLEVNGLYPGRLDNNGEKLTLRTPPGAEIFSVTYATRGAWPVTADGAGFSLVPAEAGGAVDRNNPLAWRASSNPGGSPGADDPEPTVPRVVINELLTHTDLPQLDSIELHNPTATPADLSGWYLTDDASQPRKFRIPDGTMLGAGAYVVFDESQFNPGGLGFALDSTGDELYLYSGSASGTNLTGYSHGVRFGASANGVSFGRYVNSVGEEQFPAQLSTSLPGANAGPRVGPAVITEIHYHPVTNESEFVEVLNISGSPLDLFDPLAATNTWRLNGLGFSFPTNITLPAGGLALIVGMDPASFRTRYGVPGPVQIFGPARGSLQGGGERLELQRPDPPNTNGVVPYVTVDEVRYGHRSPWPAAADGDGSSLQRIVAGAYGNDPTNWFASGLTPGGSNRATLGPFILDQPVSRTVVPGTEVQFVVTAVGNSPLFQWRKNQTDLPAETNAILALPAVSFADAGSYQVVVSDPSGSTTSAVAVLSVSCGFLLSASEATFPSAGGAGAVTVSTTGTCSWAVSNAPAWIQITAGASGLGTGTVAYTVSPNPGPQVRSAVLQIAGLTHSVIQSPPDAGRPGVTIRSPAAGARFTNRVIVLQGSATDNVRVARVEYQLNHGPFLAATGTVAWGAPLTLIPGTNVVGVRGVDLEGNISLTNTRAFFQVTTSPLTISTNGRGKVTGAGNGQRLEIGRSYRLTATPEPGSVFSNWTGAVSGTSPTLQFIMQSNLVATANFVTNPFGPVNGVYYGLFFDTNGIDHASSGYFRFALTSRGSYTAAIYTGGRRLAALGRLNLAGEATNTIPRARTNALTAIWRVDLGGSDRIAGEVNASGWNAVLDGDRAAFKPPGNPTPHAGRYTVALPGNGGSGSSPGGDAYGTVVVASNGLVQFRGSLPDRTPVAQNGFVSRRSEWPLYLGLYSGKGSAIAWVQFTNEPLTDLGGLLSWMRPAMPGAKYYAAGFTVETNLLGSRYHVPVKGVERILELTDAAVQFSGGNPPVDYTHDIVLGLFGRVTNVGPGNVSWVFSSTSGLLKGSFTPPGTNRPIAWNGVVLQKGTNASGYFLGTDRSGRVRVGARP